MRPPNANIHLTAEKSQYNLGEQVKGKIEFTSEEEFIATQLVVWLNCTEGTRYGSASIYSTFSALFEVVRVPKGFAATYSYALNIPAGAKETMYGIDHNVRWLLYAILSAYGPNIQTPAYEIQVARPQISQSSPTIMKEVTREVVLISCSYCNGLMPQTSTFCPNCGAKRRG